MNNGFLFTASLVTGLAASGCGGGPSADERIPGLTEQAATAAQPNRTRAGSTPPIAGSLRGYYTFGHEVESFQPCGSLQLFWITGPDTLLRPMRDRALALAEAAGEPYQPLYVEIKGASEGRAEEGFAARYDAVYRITDVARISETEPASCPRPEPAPDMHTTRNSVDWNGTYEGTLPCASCPGIETALTLNPDGIYVLRRRYLSDDEQPTEVKGRFTWQPDGEVLEVMF